MTAFDAAIFDLVRVALRRKFFSLVAAFGKQDKLSLLDLSQAGSWEAFRDQIIEEQLKKRYVKDLLCILVNQWGGGMRGQVRRRRSRTPDRVHPAAERPHPQPGHR